MSWRYGCIIVFGVVWTAPAPALEPRYELGQRLKAFERAWTAQHEPAARKRAVVPLLRALPAFFALQLGEAGRALDQAQRALRSEAKPAAAEEWAASLAVQLQQPLLDVRADKLVLDVRAFYKTSDLPKDAVLRVTLYGRAGQPADKPWQHAITSLPLTLQLPLGKLAERDYPLEVAVCVGTKTVHSRMQRVSLVAERDRRLQQLLRAKGTLPIMDDRLGADLATLDSHIELLTANTAEETDYPYARLLGEAEQLVAAILARRPFHGPARSGEQYLCLRQGKRALMTRVYVPPGLSKERPATVVVALHGYGGSENLFFEGYGEGEIVKLCQQRGWLLVAPRTDSFSFTSPVAGVLEALGKVYPLDPQRTYLVGHSMGAGQAMNAVQETPERFVAVAALGGSGKVPKVARLKEIAFFVGVGASDIALEGGRKLAKLLRAEGVPNVELREYADVEHIAIVAEALPDVFRWFDRQAKK